MLDILTILIGCAITAAYFIVTSYCAWSWSNGDRRAAARYQALFVGIFIGMVVMLRYL